MSQIDVKRKFVRCFVNCVMDFVTILLYLRSFNNDNKKFWDTEFDFREKVSPLRLTEFLSGMTVKTL